MVAPMDGTIKVKGRLFQLRTRKVGMDSSSSSSSSGRDGQDSQEGDPEPVSRPAPLKVSHMCKICSL